MAPRLVDAFDAEYRRLYHAVLPGYEPMVLNWRLRAVGPAPDFQLPEASTLGASGAREITADRRPRGHRMAYFPEAGGFVDTPVYDRYALPSGERLVGPAIVEERESTTIVNPGDTLLVDARGNLRISVERGR